MAPSGRRAVSGSWRTRKKGERDEKTNFVDVTEQRRLNEAREAGVPWKKWGPYLSERQWGTVREDPESAATGLSQALRHHPEGQ